VIRHSKKPSSALRVFLCLTGIVLPPVLCRAQSGYTISTVAGNATSGYTGDGGAATSAELADPVHVAVDSSGNLYIADQGNHRVRKVSNGTISVFAGNGTAGYSGDGGAATSAEVEVTGLAVDSSGNVYISSGVSNVIRKVTSAGTVSTVAGDNSQAAGFSGDDAAATKAQLDMPTGVAVDAAGNIYFSDTVNHRVRKVATTGTITTFAGNGFPDDEGDGGAATDAKLNAPRGIAVDAAGNVYIADTLNHVIRKVSPSGIITTVAGNANLGAGFSGDGKEATSAQLNYPFDVAVDDVGNLYIADFLNSRIRKVAGSNGIITTIAGNGNLAYTGDGGDALKAALCFPRGVAVAADGTVYVADVGNNVVRKLTPPTNVPGQPVISAGGVITASVFGAFNTVAPGSWIEIYGRDLAATTRNWTSADFDGVTAPTVLDGTTVLIGGQEAFIAYVSPKQVNAIVPENVGTGSQQMTVNTAYGASAIYTIKVNARQPGLFAPASLNLGGKQYVGATFSDGAWVLPASRQGDFSNLKSRPAKPGDVIVLYGTGFGPVTPDVPVGQIPQEKTTITSALEVFIGGTKATVQYQGLTPGSAGVYQFNVVVPELANGGDALPLTFTLDGVSGAQTLYTAVAL
jgi:trimeric autotransporter adhesin